MTPVTAPADTQLSRCTAYLKGEPKALGTVQIMIGTMTFLFSIILMVSLMTVFTSSIAILGSLNFIVSGALTVAATNHRNTAVLKASLIMNVLSAVAAAITLIMFLVVMVTRSGYWCYYDKYYDCQAKSLGSGIYGVLVVFSLLEIIISISTSAFVCKATCCTEPTPMNSQPMYSQPMNSPPMYSPPMYSPPMYNPAFYNPQVPNRTVVTYSV